jgi:ABC-type nitrate/sulfonate/bicarbonate transport system substrate-binding protein
MSRRVALQAGVGAIGLAALGGVGIAACGDDEPAGVGTAGGGLGALTLQLNWLRDITFGGDYAMEAKGYGTRVGFDRVELLAGGPAVAAEPVVASGKARFGYSSPELLAAARAEGAELVIIGVGYQRNPFTIVSLADRPIREPGDLVGRTVAVDDVNRVVFSTFLRANHVAESRVEVVPANFDTSLLGAHQVDAHLGYVANEAITFELQGLDVVRLDFDDHGLPDVGQAYITTERLVAERPEVVTAALLAFVRGWRWFLGDLDAGIALSRRHFDPDTPAEPHYVRRSAEAYRDNFLTDDTRAHGVLTLTPERQEAVIGGLAVGGVDATAKQLFDLSLLDRLYADRPELRAAPTGG